MAEQLVVLDGSTFFVSEPSGDVRSGDHGFYFGDTRHLSRWEVLLDGAAVDVVTSRNVDYYDARITGVSGTPRVGVDATLVLFRDRIVSGGVHEDVAVEHHGDESRRVVVELRFAADFADLFEVKEERIEDRSACTSAEVLGPRCVRLLYERDGFRRGTELRFDADVDHLGPHGATFDLTLRPHERWSVCVDVVCIDADGEHGPRTGHGGFGQLHPQMPETLDEWMEAAPELATGDDALARTYRQSLLDLAALRFPVSVATIGGEASIPAAGLPWFMAVLGRDSLLTSYMALPFQPELACATLRLLAGMQATADDAFRDAEPGKLPHELRRGELTWRGDQPHSPYYGSHDVTPLFLVVLDEYERWTGDRDLVLQLEQQARAALAWIEGPGDLDGDGFLEYRTRSPRGLVNQCWKDSPESIRFADGRVADGPIAACEIQGYAFDAQRRAARLARNVWDDPELGDRLEASAHALARRFADAFWCERRGHPALALDGSKQRVDALTSNIGHLLWSGILGEEQAAAVADHVLDVRLFSGWGVRTMSCADAGYNPLGYHVGTVWPHDTAIAAEGLRRIGRSADAARLAQSVLDAAAAFDHRLPEVFAGFERKATSLPVDYPTASRPQAWSAAAPLSALRTLLGMDALDGAVTSAPTVAGAGPLALRGVPVGGQRVDVGALDGPWRQLDLAP
jgi:glycogen debranching enzyme